MVGGSRRQHLQTVSIQEDKGVIQIATRKPGASLHAVSSGVAKSTLRNRTGSRRALGATSKLFKSGYRPDLRRVSVRFIAIFPSFPFVLADMQHFERTHPLEPAGLHLSLKVGCGHVCEIKPIPERSRSNSSRGTSSCRYQMSYNAIFSDSLTITRFPIFPRSSHPNTRLVLTPYDFRRLASPVLPLYLLHKRRRRRDQRGNHGGRRLLLPLPPSSSL